MNIRHNANAFNLHMNYFKVMDTVFDLKREIACGLRRIYIWKGSSSAYMMTLFFVY